MLYNPNLEKILENDLYNLTGKERKEEECKIGCLLSSANIGTNCPKHFTSDIFIVLENSVYHSDLEPQLFVKIYLLASHVLFLLFRFL